MALAPHEVEVQLISSLHTGTDIAEVLKTGITPDHFLLYGDVFEFILEFSRIYDGSLPKRADVEANFGGLDMSFKYEEGGKLAFYVDELRKQHMVRRIGESVTENFGQAGERLAADPDEALRGLLQEVTGLRHISTQNVALLDADALIRHAWIEERIAAHKAGKVLGIPTGLKVFDDYLQGWQAGEAILLIGPKGAGKSFLLMHFACVAYEAGRRILYLSPEMSWEECALRFDVLLARRYQEALSLSALTTGGIEDLAGYKQWLKGLTDRSDFICVDSAGPGGFTQSNVMALVEEHQPDLVLFDGLQLIRSEEREAGWETIKYFCDGMKARMQQTKSVCIWAGQVDKEGMKSGQAVSTGAQAAYSKGSVEAANRVITMGFAKHPLRRSFKVIHNRGGQEWHEAQTLIFEVDSGHIEQEYITAPMTFDEAETDI